MRAYDIIVKKRDGYQLTEAEIEFMIQEYTSDRIPDYQVAAWLMACYLNGLNGDETQFLTRAMWRSGKSLNLSHIKQPKVDKHSTGGVGDKISLILAPAVASCGIVVPMTSGRGLGFTGGTLDKLESIPGYRVNLTDGEFIELVKKVGFAMTGQTESIAPADKKLYTLRDVTGTVESIPLITSSILSKKIAEGADSIVIDVKYGSGAFMKSIKQAEKLAYSLFDTGMKMGKKVVCVITNMNQPLGRKVGNSLEVEESIECLRGNGESDLIEVTTVLGGYMLKCGDIVSNVEDGMRWVREKLKNGEAFERFKASVKAQGGDERIFDDPERLPRAKKSVDVVSESAGYVSKIDTEQIGVASVWLRAGRFTKEERIDHASGIYVRKKVGEFVKKQEPLVTLFYNDERGVEEATMHIRNAYELGEEKVNPEPLIRKVVE